MMRAKVAALGHHPEFREGQQLYHYTSAAAAKAIVGGEALWLTEFGKLNDEQEFLYAEGKLRKYLEQLRWDYGQDAEWLTKITLATSKIHTTMFVGSLTESKDDLGPIDIQDSRSG